MDMTTPEAGNRLIADFLNIERCTDEAHKDDPCFVVPHARGYHKTRDLQYHTSWGWLMPVVEKIREIDFEEDDMETVDCRIRHLTIWAEISSVWNEVVKFIQWYNQISK